MNFMILGCGAAAHFHARALQTLPEARLYAVCDRNAENARRFGQIYGAEKVFSSLTEALHDPLIEAVCVCTPSGMHAAGALECLRAGRHTLIEKPMAITLPDCESLERAADQSGALCGVISQLRFSPDIRRVRDAIAQKRAGKLLLADLDMRYFRPQSYYDENPWRGTYQMDGGGTLMNQGIHGVDLLQHLTGGIQSISAFRGTLSRKIETEDTLCAAGTLACGAFYTLRATCSAEPGFPRKMTFTFEKGVIEVREERISSWFDGSFLPASAPEGLSETFRDPQKLDISGHAAQIRNLIGAACGREKLLIDAREGRKPVEIILAAYRSAQEGRTITLEQ